MKSSNTSQKLILTILSIGLLLSISAFHIGNELISKSGKSIRLKVAAYNVEFSDKGSAREIGLKLKPYAFDVVCFSEAPGGNWTREVADVMGLDHIACG